MGAKSSIRTWLRFDLRTLFVVVTVFGVWLGWQIHKKREQARVVSAVNALGGKSVLILRDGSLLSRWNTAFFPEANDFWFNSVPIEDRDLKVIASAPDVVGLHLADNWISDE